MILPVFLPHLGCGKRCIYCNQDLITGITDKNKGLNEFLSILFDPITSPVEVGLYGGNVLGLSAHELKDLFRLFNPFRNRISGFRLSAKPTPVSRGIVTVLRKNMVHTIELGIPCMNDTILTFLGRGHSTNDFFTTFDLLKNDFALGLQVMVGLPGETGGDIRATAAMLSQLHPQFLRIYPLLVIDGTPLAQMWRQSTFVPDSVEQALEKAVYISLKAGQAGTKVIKMGLTENEVLLKKVIAGPYHPAFGYLVKAESFYLAIAARCNDAGLSGEMKVHLNPKDLPHLLGDRRKNIARFSEKGMAFAWVMDQTIEEGSFCLVKSGKRETGNINDALAMLPY